MIAPYILLDDQMSGAVRRYNNPIDIIQADNAEDVPRAFESVQRYNRQGYHLAGYCAYELGYVLEPCLQKLIPEKRSGPLMQFGVFESCENKSLPDTFEGSLPPLSLSASWSAQDYAARFEKVLEYIQAGDVYQINLTFPMHGQYSGTAWNLYQALRSRQPGRYGGVISLGGPDIISLSPELFFQKTDLHMAMRPMKGTVRRQADPVQDAAARDAMRKDIKSQAENLMIVDLLRNDLSRISQTGSVKVPELFALETYPTLHQMTSQVHAQLRPDVDISEIFRSLFPCGSVTGAPKIRAMEIIRQLEDMPRGAYCGSIGYLDPNGDACFNVAIRTLTLSGGDITYNVGSGVVLDSGGQDEYDECLLKAKVVMDSGPELIETMRWVPNTGIVRRARHMDRLERSARALGYSCDVSGINKRLNQISEPSAQRVRLALSPGGSLQLESVPFKPSVSKWKVSLSKNPLTRDVQETRHKVSARDFYDSERVRLHAMTRCDDVLFFNAQGQLCEGSFTSVFAEIDNQLFTPDIKCGLLPGILREEMIEAGDVVEAVMTLDDLRRASRIYIGNSLRGLIHVDVTGFSPL